MQAQSVIHVFSRFRLAIKEACTPHTFFVLEIEWLIPFPARALVPFQIEPVGIVSWDSYKHLTMLISRSLCLHHWHFTWMTVTPWCSSHGLASIEPRGQANDACWCQQFPPSAWWVFDSWLMQWQCTQTITVRGQQRRCRATMMGMMALAAVFEMKMSTRSQKMSQA